MLKPLTLWITTNHEKFLMRWEYQTTWPVSWEICMQIKKQQLKSHMEQWTGSKLEKEYVKTVYCHLVYLTYMQSTSCEMPGWMKHKLESRLWREIVITSDMQMTPPLWKKVKRISRASWWKWKESEKPGLKPNIQKMKIMTLHAPILHANRWGNNGNSDQLYFLGLQNYCGQRLQPLN